MEKPDSHSDAPDLEASPQDSETLESNTEKIAQSAREQMSQIDKDFDAKLASMGDRIKNSQSRHKSESAKVSNSSGMDPETARGLGVGLTVAYAVIGVPLFGYGIGKIIERFTGTGQPTDFPWASTLTLVGAVIGVVFAIMVANRSNK